MQRVADDEAPGPKGQLGPRVPPGRRGPAAHLSLRSSGPPGQAEEDQPDGPIDKERQALEPLGLSGSTMVNSTLAAVRTTTTRPTAKSTLLTARAPVHAHPSSARSVVAAGGSTRASPHPPSSPQPWGLRYRQAVSRPVTRPERAPRRG